MENSHKSQIIIHSNYAHKREATKVDNIGGSQANIK
jgi:hypothetical protein